MDLLIAGGGPVGLATALYADRAGLAVTVLEPRAAPIDKACGEGLMPGALRALQDLGIDPVGIDFRGIRYLDGDISAEAPFRDGPGRGVRRTVLQAALHDAVTGRGIPIVAGPVGEYQQDDQGVRVGERSARYLIGADGLHSAVRRRAGLAVAAAPGDQPRWGLRCHYGIEPWTDLVEVYWARGAEAYVTPVAADQVGVAILTAEPGTYHEQLARFGQLRRRLGDAAGSKVRGAGPLRQRTRSRVSGRVLLVGDAAGYIDALTGEGIAVGLAAARGLIGCLVADDPAAYERIWLQTSRRYRLLTAGLVWSARRPLLRRRIVPAAAKLPGLFGRVVDQLAR
jgi:2-polyprenyl-6-methoxyphenol hydroxylase-like FAD-dependent oxidoreductase